MSGPFGSPRLWRICRSRLLTLLLFYRLPTLQRRAMHFWPTVSGDAEYSEQN
jgi:hypothetical protein